MKVTTPTPLSCIAIFVRAGTVLPIGKRVVTITSRTDLPSTTADGTRIRLRDTVNEHGNKGIVELDDWRGLELYPPPFEAPLVSGSTGVWCYEWQEDDGETDLAYLETSRVRCVMMTPSRTIVQVSLCWVQRDFKTLWNEVW